ncbi:MAG: hypothetical protein J5977_15040 [Fibrobacter sp.]|nr:hypothetical protein [Fibrobacter sp.]
MADQNNINVIKDTMNLKAKTEEQTPYNQQNVSAMMYDKLREIFGNGSQLFTMEFPGRVLNKDDFIYDIKDYNGSSLNKPYSVAENEFRLSDNLLDPYPIVQGPSGNYLSNVYSTAINNLAPKITDVKDFITDKMELRMFLLQPVTDEFDGKTVTCTRLEFCQKTYLRYLNKKYEWNQEKIDRRNQFEKDNDLDGYARWLATTAWTKDHELETLFNDAIIRGFYHEVMTILGFLDAESPSERLARAKNARISSSWRSLDESREILPVSFQPSNWAHALKSNFSFTDLSMDPEYLQTEYLEKQRLLSDYEAEMRILKNNSAKQKSVADLEALVEKENKKLIDAEDKCFAEYTKAQADMIKLAFEVAANGDMVSFLLNQTAQNATETVLKGLKASDAFKSVFAGNSGDGNSIDKTIESLVNATYKVYSENLKYFEAFSELVDLKAALAQAKTSSYEDRIIVLTEKIKEIKHEMQSIASIITAGAVKTADDKASDELLPLSKDDDGINFMDIVFTKSDLNKYMTEDKDATHAKLAGSLGNLFFNTKAGLEYTQSYSSFVEKIYSSDFTVGMRVMKVTIDRGGWFDPGLFDISSSFMKIRKNIIASTGASAKSFLNAYEEDGNTVDASGNPKVNTPETAVEKLLTVKGADEKEYTVILPIYPTSFLIVKDFVVKANDCAITEEDYKNYRNVSANTTTSIFGIRVSGGFTNESYMSCEKIDESKSNLYIRTPGPQILGWFSETTAKDDSSDYKGLSQSPEFNQIIDELKAYRDKLNKISGKSEGVDYTNGVTTIGLPV